MERSIYKIIAVIFSIGIIAGCKKSSSDTPAPTLKTATVQTGTVTGITTSEAQVVITLTDTGTAKVTALGIVYGATANPTVGGAQVPASATAKGSYTLLLSGLPASTTYHVRAFATNSAGTAYGTDQTFTTLAPPVQNPPTVTCALAVPPDPTYAAVFGHIASPDGVALTSFKADLATDAAITSPTALPDPAPDANGDYVMNLNNLTSGTEYWLRVRATDSRGLVGEKVLHFTTP